MINVGIIGAGASGLAAACVLAASAEDVRVTLIEKKEQAGKKLLLTGNGRCNYSHTVIGPEDYHASDPTFISRFLERFSPEDARSFFLSLGMLSAERNGGLYPASFQASSVLNVLLDALKQKEVPILCNSAVSDIKPDDVGFLVKTEEGKTYRFTHLILACGSPSGTKDRHPFNAYSLLETLGHTVKKPLPSLVKLNGEEGFEKAWSGVRVRARISLDEDSDTGEVQLTESGISGIPVFQLSHRAVRELEAHPYVTVEMDFLPEYSAEVLTELLSATDKNRAVLSVLRGWLPRKLTEVILKKKHIYPETKAGELTEQVKRDLVGVIKRFPYRVTGHGSFAESQVTSGGVPLEEITDDFGSRLCPGLYITGELLDADGKCGGYNLHFAWGSGKLAAEAILRGKG